MSIKGTIPITTLLLLLFVMSLQGSGGTILMVDHAGSATYETIQEAIDDATDGDVIQVSEGRYREHLSIQTQDITVEGVGDGEVIVDAMGTGNGSFISVNWVTLRNINFTNSSKTGGIHTGVYVFNAEEVIIENCTFYDNKYGIYATESTKLWIYDSNFTEHRYGVFQYECVQSRLLGLRVTNSTNAGIALYRAQIATISGSADQKTIVSGTPYGVQVYGGHNIFVNLTATDCWTYGIELDNVIIAELVLDLWDLPSGGIRIQDSRFVYVTGKIGAGGRCIYVPGSTDVFLSDMNLSATDEDVQRKGLFLYNGSEAMVENIQFWNMREAVNLQEGCVATITDATFNGSSQYSYDALCINSRLTLMDALHRNASSGVFRVENAGWISVKNTIDIKIAGFSEPVPDVDLEVVSEEGVVYKTDAFGGSDPRTDASGMVYNISVSSLRVDGAGDHYNETLVNIQNGSNEYNEYINTSKRGIVTIGIDKPSVISWSIQNKVPLRSKDTIQFNVIYYDPEGLEPTIHDVIIDGEAYEMGFNRSHDEGELYSYYKDFEPGNYSLQFRFSDGYAIVYTNSTVFEILNTPPVIIAVDLGEDLPYWDFMAKYRDHDGDAPVDVRLLMGNENISMNRSYSGTDWKIGEWYSVELTLENGLHNYSFRVFDGTDWSEPMDQLSIDILEYRPTLKDVTVIPTTGNTTTTFDLRVTYQHDLDKYPNDRNWGAPTLYIMNTSYIMELRSGVSPAVGLVYYKSFSNIPRGTHPFYITVTDGTFPAVTEIEHLTIGNAAPTLDLSFTPSEGERHTEYRIVAEFTDADNDPVDSLSIELGPVTYEIGNLAHPIFDVWEWDDSTTNGKGFMITLTNLSHGLHYYRVNASDGIDNVTREGVLTVNMIPKVEVDRDHWSVDDSTTMTFICNYSDNEGDLPLFINIMFTGSVSNATVAIGPFAMGEIDVTDVSVQDGKEYFYSRRFDPGTYTYEVTASDGYSTVTSPLYPFYVSEPDLPPVLLNASVSPIAGTTRTIFNITVRYTHPNGDPPDAIYVTYGQNTSVLDRFEGSNFTSGVFYRVNLSFDRPKNHTITIYAITNGVTTEEDVWVDVVENPALLPEEERKEWIDLPSAFTLGAISLLVAILVIAVYEGHTLYRSRIERADLAVTRLTHTMLIMKKKGIVFDRSPIVTAKVYLKKGMYSEAERTAHDSMADLKRAWEGSREARDLIGWLDDHRDIIPDRDSREVRMRLRAARLAFEKGLYKKSLHHSSILARQTSEAMERDSFSYVPVEVIPPDDEGIQLADMPFGDDIEEEFLDFEDLDL